MNKAYSAFMTEIEADELYKGLLAYGLFSEKMPPVFTSESFYQYCESISHSFEERAHNYIYYENMRNINIPRSLAIPNPMAYQMLCRCLRDNWGAIQEHFENMTKHQTYKVSRIHIRRLHQNPALFEMNYDNWRVDGSPEIDISFGKRYIVRADISSCFPSIYTHALPWALATKEQAKSDRNPSSWYNSIDLYARNIKNAETHGLLIGPHASNLLAEIILTAIDKKLSHWEYMRKIDDYTCYVRTYEEGQKFLTELAAALRTYDLSLNHKKTEISELPLAATDHWQRKLNSISLVTGYGKTDYKLTQAYIDYAVELMHRNKENAAILNYAVKVLAGKDLTVNAQKYCMKTVQNLSMIYPYLVSILDEYVFKKYCSSCQDHHCIEQYANIIYCKGLETNNFEQIAYALFFAIKYRVGIESFKASDAIGSRDCIFLLFAFIYASQKKLKDDIKALKSFAELLATDDEAFEQNWLFVYEVLPNTKLKGEWKGMKRKRVSFLKPIEIW